MHKVTVPIDHVPVFETYGYVFSGEGGRTLDLTSIELMDFTICLQEVAEYVFLSDVVSMDGDHIIVNTTLKPVTKTKVRSK
jgi:hypothetical protein